MAFGTAREWFVNVGSRVALTLFLSFSADDTLLAAFDKGPGWDLWRSEGIYVDMSPDP